MSVRQNMTPFPRRSFAIYREVINPEEIRNSKGISPFRASVVCIFYYIFLAISYVLEVQPKWRLSGFDIDPSPIFMLMSFVSIFAFFFGTRKRTRFNRLTLSFAFLSIYVPASVYISFANPSFYLWLVYFVSIIPLLYLSSLKIPIIRGKTISRNSFIYILVFVIGFLVLLVATRLGFSNISFDLYAVYDFRDDVASEIGVHLNRILSFTSKLFLPLLVIYALTVRSRVRYFLIAIAIIYALLIFGYWQHKSAIFLPLAVLGLYAILSKGRAEHNLLSIFLFLSIVLAFEAMIFSLRSTPYPGTINALIGRRALFVPPLLTDLYVQFFSSNEKFYWYSLTQHFGAKPPDYGLAPAFVIGLNFFDSDEMSANVGFVGSGYANAGMTGVLLYSTAMGFILAYLSSQAKILGSVFSFCLTALVVHTALASSDLLTTLRSHGLFLTMLILPFLKSPLKI